MIPADESHARASDVHPHVDVNGPLGATPPVSDQRAVAHAADGRADVADNVAPAISNDNGATTPGGQ